jgi:hypothetical protein
LKNARYVLSIWVEWFFLTALYLVLLFSKIQAQTTAAVVGLFVPIGPFNLVASIHGGSEVRTQHAWLITFPLTVGVFVLADFVANKWKIPMFLRVGYNLLVLLAVTAAVDFILWHEWKSWNLANF